MGIKVHYAPGEHVITDPATQKAYLERYGKGTKGGGWYSFDQTACISSPSCARDKRLSTTRGFATKFRPSKSNNMHLF